MPRKLPFTMQFGERNPFDRGDFPSLKQSVGASIDRYRQNYDYFERGLRSDVPFYYKPLEVIGRGAIAHGGAVVKTLFDPDVRQSRYGASNKPPVVGMNKQQAKKTEKKGPVVSRRPPRRKQRGPTTFNGRNPRARPNRKTARRYNKFPAVSYALNAKAGPKFKFSQGRGKGDMRMMMHFKVCQIAVGTSTSANVPVFGRMGITSSNYDFVLPLNPSATWYYPSFVTNLASCFQCFRVNFASLKIMPRVNTSNNAVVTLGYARDPTWPQNTGQVSGGFSFLTENQISSLPSSCTEVLYRDCVVIADGLERNKKYYMANPLGGGAYMTAEIGADMRDSCAGLFVVSGVRNGTDSAGTIYADVYMNIDFELCEFNTSITGEITALKNRVVDREDTLDSKSKHSDYAFDDLDEHIHVVKKKSNK